MIYSSLITSALLAASTLVQATPLVTRGDGYGDDYRDDYRDGFLKALNKAGAVKLADRFAEFSKTPEGQKFVKSIEYDDKLSFVAPVDSAFDSCSLDEDLYQYFSFSTIYGDVISSKRAKYNSRSIKPSKMRSADLRKRGGANQVQVIDTYYENSQKRWDGTTVLINKAVGAAKVLTESKFKNINIVTTDSIVTVPTRLDDLLCKPLVESAPYGFTKLGGGLQRTGQSDLLFNAMRTTLFAPIDSAFDQAELSDSQLAEAMPNHFVPWVIYSTGIPYTPVAKAKSGKELKLELVGLDAYVSCGKTKAAIIRSDVTAKNGVIHVIDKLLTCDY